VDLSVSLRTKGFRLGGFVASNDGDTQRQIRVLATEIDKINRALYGMTQDDQGMSGQLGELRREYAQLSRNVQRILRAVEGDTEIGFAGLRSDMQRVVVGLGSLQSDVASLKQSPHAKVAELEEKVKGLVEENKAFRNRLDGALGLAKAVAGLFGLAGATGVIAYLASLLGVG
jgi:Mg2+ and Co2+ transporter CorA